MELRVAGTDGTAVTAVAVAATVTRIEMAVVSEVMTAGLMEKETESAAKAARVDTSPLHQLLALSAWRCQGLHSPGLRGCRPSCCTALTPEPP